MNIKELKFPSKDKRQKSIILILKSFIVVIIYKKYYSDLEAKENLIEINILNRKNFKLVLRY